MRLPRLYCIVDKETLDARAISVGVFAQELRDAGVRLVQYRDKKGGPQEILRGAAEVAEAFAGVENAMLVMNDRADLASLMGWGVHVGQGDLPVKAAKAVLLPNLHTEDARARDTDAVASTGEIQGSLHYGTKGAPSVEMTGNSAKDVASVEMTRLLVGVSTHTEEQVRVADAGMADYVAIGPVFGTATKLDAEPVVGLEGVRRARALTAKPLVAIGGIRLETAQSVIDAGADSVAVIGGMFVPGRSVGEVARDFLERLR